VVGSDELRDGLTIREAATLLGVHPNTVRNRIKDGTYEAEKILTDSGPTYYVSRESLLNNAASQPLPIHNNLRRLLARRPRQLYKNCYQALLASSGS
jgi:excisionase family DNA binding protein